MLRKLSTRNALSLILSISLLLGTLCGGLNVFAAETETAEHSYVNLSYSTDNTYQDFSAIDFNTYGKNLIPDSNVSQFTDGVYNEYYDLVSDPTGRTVLNPNAWWDKVPDIAMYFDKNDTTYGSMKVRELISNDTGLSHTADGSGVLKSPANKATYLPLQEMKAQTYYLITMWVKMNTFEYVKTGIKDFTSNSEMTGTQGSYIRPYDTWKRYTYIYYTGSISRSAAFYFYADKDAYIDDFAMYELDSAYAASCIEAGKLLTDKDLLPDAAATVYLTNDTEDGVYFGGFGENLIPDSTVSQFNEDGIYKSYYDLDTDSTGGAVLDSNAWWDKAGNRYQYFFNNSNAYGSMNKLGYCSNNITLSHTKDSSGVLSVLSKKDLYLPLPVLEAKTYYVITAWINPSKATTLTTRIFNSKISKLSEKMVWANAGWQRVTWLYYTGADQQKEAIFYVYGDQSLYIDDVAVYKLDDAYGTKCVNNSKLLSNREIVLGDVNCDDKIDILDLVRIKKVLAEVTCDYLPANAKLDSDNAVTAADMAILKQYLIGSITSFN